MLSPLDRLMALPANAFNALRTLSAIADHTEAMRAHTALLSEVTAAPDRVARDTDVLPGLREDMARVADTTRVLAPMDGRMAAIERTMPVLVEVQQHLADLPEIIGRLDERMNRLSGLLERMLGSLDGLSESVGALQASVEPMGRLAQRLPRQNRDRGARSQG